MFRLKELREAKGISQYKLSNILNISRSAIAMWETGKAMPNTEILTAMADLFDVSLDYLLARTNETKTSYNRNVIRVPVLGYVAAGVPIETIEDILDYEELDSSQFDTNYEYFGLKIKGDSMSPRIQNGDVVIVRKQPDIESGEVAIVCVNGDNATCKQIQKHADGISLISYNTAYEIKFYSNKEIEELPITILGKVVELRGKF